MRPLWARTGAPSVQSIVARFTVGGDRELDRQLLIYDALGSAAHATMLERIGVLDARELAALVGELRAIVDDVQAGRFGVGPDDEDGHTALEHRLTDKLGEAGQRIHTGRSRNDQVIGALRLYARVQVLDLARELLALVALLIERARPLLAASMPGYTHTRQAMPTTVGHWLSAYADALLDDLPWLQQAHAHVDRSPLGSASGYGVALPLDRELVARLLGFSALQHHTLAVQNDRGKTEALLIGVAATIGSDLGRLASDLIWGSSEALGFVVLDDGVTTGSSIMPQKRNPDVLELVRAGAARLRARTAEVAGIYAPLTAGYHRDLQLTKEPLLDALPLCRDLLQVMQLVVRTMTIDVARCAQAIDPASASTDEVYRRVAQGTPFRVAYKQVAEDPVGALQTTDRLAAIGLWQQRTHAGAPGDPRLLDPIIERVAQGQVWLAQVQASADRAWQLLS